MTTEKNKVIFILLDACRCDYISEATTPFIFQLGQQGRYYKKLQPSHGFCERTEIFVGLNSQQSGYFTAFGRNPLESPYRRVSYILKVLGYFEKKFRSSFFSKAIRRLVWEVAKYFPNTYYPARIPLADLSNYSLTEDGKVNALEHDQRSLFQRYSVFQGAMTSLKTHQSLTDDDRFSLVLKNIDRPYDLYPIYIGELDTAGHKFGPDSIKLISTLNDVDKKIEEFWNKINTDPKIKLVICGDHGMSKVTKIINVKDEIEKLIKSGKIDKNTTYFIDSTMVRFWFNDKKNQKEIIKQMLSENFLSYGKIIDKVDYKINNIPCSVEYGDLIFTCKNGTVINPDFFTPSTIDLKGMHGYVPTKNEHFGFCIISGSDIKYEKKTQVFPLTYVYTELHILLNQHVVV